MTQRVRRRALAFWLLAPLAAVPVLALALMEYGPERSFLFALYLLVWAVAFFVIGLAVAMRRPAATTNAVLARAALWAMLILAAAVAVLFALSFLGAPDAT